MLDVAFFKYENEAIKDVISVSEMTKREGVYTVVINTTPNLTGLPETSGSITTRMIASITNGMHHEASRSVIKRGQKPAEEISEAMLQAQRRISHVHYLTCKPRIK